MAVDLWPYSSRQDGAVADTEHEALWRSHMDGIVPYEPDDALATEFASGQWTVQPGRLFLAGHILALDAPESGPLPPGTAEGDRTCVLAASIDRTTAPWTYGIQLVQGDPGGGRPPLEQTLDGKWQVPLAAVQIAANGGITPLGDERVRLQRIGAMPESTGDTASSNEATTSEGWQNGDTLCQTTFTAPPSGIVMVYTYARGFGSDDPAGSLIVAFSIRADSSAGAVVYEPQAEDGPIIRGRHELGLTVAKRITGLDPGRGYYIRTAHRSSRQNVRVEIRHRRLTIVPLAS